MTTYAPADSLSALADPTRRTIFEHIADRPSAVKDLVVGSGFQFTHRGQHELKRVPGEWQLCVVGR